MLEGRFPSRLYADGDEPDPRFSLANERTYLAWIRTSLALLAGAGVLLALDLPVRIAWQWGAAMLFAVASVTAAIWAWVAWVTTERRLRHHRPLPGLGFGGGISVLVVVAVMVLAIGFALGEQT